ncbi:MAG TPA: alanine racemase [Chloroflexota bacterium]|nr:alanine racemase [Chloroflexota bacterium]
MILLGDLLDGAAEEGARVLGDVRADAFEGLAYDSRNVRGGELFVAVRTDRADGHDFLADAVGRGAAGVLCERVPQESVGALRGATVVEVRDTRAALRRWASHVLRRQGPRVIAVTGSVGKTGTAKAIAGVLRRLRPAAAVFENDNFNDLFGLPIALAGLEPAHETAALELGTDSAGEIAELCALVGPSDGVITNVAPAHLQHFGSLERLAQEYGALARTAGERLFLNVDDPLVAAMGAAEASRGNRQRVTFGTDERADVRASGVALDPDGVSFTLHWGGAQRAVSVPRLGMPAVYAALAAAAVGLADGHPLDAVGAALGEMEPVAGRLRPLRLARRGRLLDDTFSASPPSLAAALGALAAMPAPRLVVLGEVSGLEDVEAAGAELARAGDAAIALGDDAERVTQAAVEHGLPREQVDVTHTVEEAVARAEAWLAAQSGAEPAVLVKGNEASRLERVVERLMAEPGRARELLVRQAPGARQVVGLQLDRAAWMEVDLDAIAGNLERLRAIAAPAAVMAVLKADAYGHGAVRVARTAVQHGAAALGVAVLSEAAALRERGIGAPILVLGYTPAWQARDVVRAGVAVSVFSLDVAQALSRASAALARPAVRVHIKVDTGMHRLGVAPEEAVGFARAVAALPGVEIEGVFTHFASADEADDAYTRLQLERFRRVLAEWEAAGLARPQWVHAANSAATLRFPEARFDMVRTGIALYGMHPSGEVRCPEGFRAALRLKTQLAQVKEIEEGEPVSYGRTWVAARRSRIGILPIGYADGFRRAPANWGEVLVRGRRAPVVGRVCMDMCVVDVTDVEGARVGDEVVLIGEQQEDRLTAEEVAAQLGTINYEVVSQILARVPREIVSR